MYDDSTVCKQTKQTFVSLTVNMFPFFVDALLNSVLKRKAQNVFKNVISEKFRKQFCFLTCILSDYVAHKSFKEFWKNSNFENM